ncbi:esterase E4-like [Copidosoma floridanum]|uniref:esterase E4-like n=1 Tax=Copidosoma floridanum TaxID=29053 RepID=UPI0006C9B04B|nr:esterase E4-like [Copidosoma floridanum]
MKRPEVDTEYGRLRGLVQKNIENVDYFAFKGIPYAQKSTGSLRFKDPVRAEPWSGTKDAIDFGPMCTQYDPVLDIMGGSDDCLYLNVYTKDVDPHARLPVMVWIHGGGFQFGSAHDDLYGADFLMKKDVVLVSFNYRLGILGFLNLDHEVATGNQGLKDQVFALQWVQENIVNFGGDPNNVTIFGESAGGASVHYLTLSPLAKGLFHKAISHSGVSTCPWGNCLKEKVWAATEICKYLGKSITDPEEIVEFLQTVNDLELIKAQEHFKKKEGLCYFVFNPDIDAKSKEPFMPLSKEIAVKKGANVPYMIGHNNREGTMLLKFVGLRSNFSTMNDEFLSFVLTPESIQRFEQNKITLQDLKNMYCTNGNITEDIEGLSDLIGDVAFVCGIHDIVKIQVEKNSGPTYMYEFTYDKGYDLTKTLFKSTLSGASHMDELPYLFSMKILESFNIETPKKGSADYRKMEQLVELWTNFARTGMPTPTTSELIPLYWQPVNDGTVFRYLEIGEELHMKKMLNINDRFEYKKNSFPDFQ